MVNGILAWSKNASFVFGVQRNVIALKLTWKEIAFEIRLRRHFFWGNPNLMCRWFRTFNAKSDAIENNSIKSNPMSRCCAQHVIAPRIHRNSWKTRIYGQNAMVNIPKYTVYLGSNDKALDFAKHETTVNHVRKQCRQCWNAVRGIFWFS